MFHIVDDFFNKMPQYFVVFSGSDDRRQRLYRIVISRELEQITKKFSILGGIGNIILPFEANKTYDFYLIKKL